jgi:hypothetical protein
LAERFQRQLRRPRAIHMNALRLEQELHCFKDMRLVVGYQYADFCGLARDG